MKIENFVKRNNIEIHGTPVKMLEVANGRLFRLAEYSSEFIEEDL